MEPLPIFDAGNLVTGTALVSGFVIVLFLLSLAVPGPTRQGASLEGGARLQYKLNGLYIVLLILAGLALGAVLDIFSLSVLHRYFWGLFVGANLLSLLMTAALMRARDGKSSWLSDLW